MRFFKFPISGATLPISNPINPDPNQFGPFKTDIVVNPANGKIYILYIDYHSGQNLYFIKYTTSTDGGITRTVIPSGVVQIGNWLPMRPDLFY